MKNNITQMNATVRRHLMNQVEPADATASETLAAFQKLEIETPRELLDHYLTEIGIIGFTDQIIHAIAEINKATNSEMGCSRP